MNTITQTQQKQVIFLYSSEGKRIKTLVFRLENENAALWTALTVYAPKYNNVTGLRCERIINL